MSQHRSGYTLRYEKFDSVDDSFGCAAVIPWDSDIFGFALVDRWDCLKRFHALVNEGIFTPYYSKPSVDYPISLGGMDWGGITYDPSRNILVVNSNNILGAHHLAPHKGSGGYSPLIGTPYRQVYDDMMSMFGAPCNAPPWGRLTGINMTTGKKIWEVPLGTTRDEAPWPLWFHLGVPNQGGAITTVDVIKQGNDFGQIEPTLAKMEEDLGQVPQRYLADGGFASKEDIEAVHKRYPETEIYAPVKKVEKEEAKAEKEAPAAAKEERAVHPANPGIDATEKEAIPGAKEGATGEETRGKEQAEKAGTNKKAARKKPARQRKDKPGVAAWRARMDTPEGKEIYKRRAQTAELSNAQARNRGLYQVLVRGLVKVKAVVLWHALAHNLTRLWALRTAAA